MTHPVPTQYPPSTHPVPIQSSLIFWVTLWSRTFFPSRICVCEPATMWTLCTIAEILAFAGDTPATEFDSDAPTEALNKRTSCHSLHHRFG